LSDPLAAPEIHPRYLFTPEDLAGMLDGVRYLRRLAAAPAMAALIESELKPGAAVRSDDTLVDDIRQRAGTVFHPTSTCIVGPDPSSAVVDARLSVRGLAALRIIDASIFPCVPSRNTNAPTIMVGEKGAELLLDGSLPAKASEKVA
jgi:choline dehydrogenase